MLKLDRYLLSEFAQATFAALVVLLIVSFGGVFANVLKDIAAGRVPVGMMLPQLGLLLVNWMPLVLPLALMIGMLLGMGRLYRDSEMPVIASTGVGPRRLLKPVLLVALPVLVVVAMCSLWLGPWAEQTSRQMIAEANRNLIVAGLEPGRFTELPGGGGVVYIGSMSNEGSHFSRVFIYRQKNDRIDVTTSNHGKLTVNDDGERYLTLEKGFEVEGPRNSGRDFNLMRYARNEVLLPAGEQKDDPRDPEALSTPALLGDPRREAKAQLHSRIAPVLFTLIFALLAVPLARSSPRQARFGAVTVGFLAYLVAVLLMRMGTTWIERGKLSPALGLWWLLVPLAVVALWLYFNDGNVRGPRRLTAKARA